MPDESLGADELLAVLWDDPGTVIGDERAAAAGVVREVADGRRVGHLRLVAVHPGARRLGRGRALIDTVEAWAADQGATEMVIGGEAPFYLWPGVDVRRTAMLSLAEVAGYAPRGAECNMSCSTSFRHAPADGIDLRRVIADADAEQLVALVRADWPWWSPEVGRGIEGGGAFVATEESQVVGFACHSVNRAGWVGPMASSATRRGRGIGSALLGAVCRDLMVAGHADAEIAWVGPVPFYARAAGAAVSRVFRTYGKALPGAEDARH